VKVDEKYLAHYGILRKSGRYPWGSSSNQSTRNRSFLDYVDDLRTRLGYSEVQIAETIGISTTQLRAAKTIAKAEQKQSNIAMAQRLKDKGMGNVEIGKRMGINESSVRALLKPGEQDKADVLMTVSTMLKDEVAQKKYLDVGTGVEQHIGISETKLKAAVANLQEEGYSVHYIKVLQLGTGKETTVKVLVGPETTWSELNRNKNEIQQIMSYSDDNGRTVYGILPPKSFDSNRLQVRYAEEGGRDADGVIYVRPGVDDISIGGSMYAQVRIQVDGTHYIKGMAMYKDDLPDGVDLLFNTNKSNTGNKLDALKPLKEDSANPFGTLIDRQIISRDADGKEIVTSVMNLVREEGSWAKWSKSISPQVLSKQSPTLARTQLNMTYEARQKELNDILALTNPIVKQKLLLEYAEGVDSAAVYLKAQALPRQATHVILPVESLSENEVYAPNYLNGERVVLIRYPHGGIFEIPELTVNNNHPESKKLLGDARDAVGISTKVAERLSGADFDGDTVLVIPNNQNKIKTSPALDGLKNFDPQRAYPGYPGMKKMTNTQTEMGKISNLITDMTLQGAPHSEIVRAVRHSMVVIDAEKHGLNYKESKAVNGIKELERKYQPNGGASTIVSRAKGQVRIPERRERRASEGGRIDPETGKIVYVETGNVSWRTGELIKTKDQRLAVTEDAFELSSGTPMENLYASQSNRLKDLANKARKETLTISNTKWSESAKKVYSNEVTSLDNKLSLAIRNRPLERQAQIIANSIITQKKQFEPNMPDDKLKRVKTQALEQARTVTGAHKSKIVITQDEWNAIQQGAISTTKLRTILDNADMDVVKELATPRPKLLMTNTKVARANSMLASGYTRAEVASALGVSLSTLDEATNA
jgi:DNA-binding CsgD family transcriptional regulator